jgi:hypothetical protein
VTLRSGEKGKPPSDSSTLGAVEYIQNKYTQTNRTKKLLSDFVRKVNAKIQYRRGFDKYFSNFLPKKISILPIVLAYSPKPINAGVKNILEIIRKMFAEFK